jgi:hypothetical protein
MVQKSTEGNYRMAKKTSGIEKKILKTDDENQTEDRKRIKLIRDTIKSQEKELVVLKRRVKSNYSEETWMELSDLKKSFEKQILEIVTTRDSNFKGWTLKKLAVMTDYYTYQHTEKPILKTDDENAEWITEFIANGGSKAELIQKASSTREKTWVNMRLKKQKKKVKEVDTSVNGKALRDRKDKKSEDEFDSNRGLT